MHDMWKLSMAFLPKAWPCAELEGAQAYAKSVNSLRFDAWLLQITDGKEKEEWY